MGEDKLVGTDSARLLIAHRRCWSDRHGKDWNAVPGEESILLTFSGGGHSLEFSFSSDEDLDGQAWEVQLGIEVDRYEISGSAGTEPVKLSVKRASMSWERSFGHERVFAWASVDI